MGWRHGLRQFFLSFTAWLAWIYVVAWMACSGTTTAIRAAAPVDDPPAATQPFITAQLILDR